MNTLELVSMPLRKAGLNGFRLCFESAHWLSSDGNIKSYYHAHVQHDNFPDYNSGVGANSVNALKEKIGSIIVPELRALSKSQKEGKES